MTATQVISLVSGLTALVTAVTALYHAVQAREGNTFSPAGTGASSPAGPPSSGGSAR